MRRRRALFAMAGCLLVLSATAATAVDSRDDELADTRSRLGQAERELNELEEAVRRTNEHVGALDTALTAATTELAAIGVELVDAEVALATASAAHEEAAQHLAGVDDELQAALHSWEEHRTLMQARAVRTFKHGAAGTHDVLLLGLAGAGDWHEVMVTLETVDRLAAEEQALVQGSVELTRSTSELRAAAGTAREQARRLTRDTIVEERRLASLLEHQRRVVADVEASLAQRATLLAELENDVAARAVLVRDLERRVAELELASSMVLVPIDVDLDVHGPPPEWADRLPPAGRPYAAAFEAIGARHGVDGRLIAALVWTESNFRPDAVSRAGALGLAQLMPGTARGLGVDPRHPLENIDGGTRYLRTQLDRFGSVDLALAAYNAGPGRVERAGPGVPNIVETQLYVVRVLERYEQLTR